MSASPSPPPALTSGPVGRRLIRMTLPMTLGLFANMLFNLVDTFYIGFLGQAPLAAMAFTFPLVFFVTGTSMGMGIGVAATVSRALGQGAEHRVRRLTTDSLLLALLLVSLLVGLGLLLLNPVVRRMGATPEQIPLIRSYLVPWFCGVVFIVVPMIGNASIRATGDTLRPSLIMLLAGLINVILDPLLIFGIGPFPRMELAGAALATVISYVCITFASFWLLRSKYKLLTFRFEGLRATLHSWREVTEIALPAIGTNQMIPVANGVITSLVARHGEAATAAWSVVIRLESLMMSPSFALSTVMAPFVGQNLGASAMTRIAEALRFAAKFCFGVSLVVWLAVASAGPWIGARFSENPETLHWISRYLWIVPFSYGPFGLMLQFTSAFNAMRHPLKSTGVFLSRFFLFIIPLAWWGQSRYGLTGLFIGIAIGNTLACLMAVIWWGRSRILKNADI